MTKEEKIQEGYGEYWEEMKPWINENCWFNKNAFYQKEFKFKYDDLDLLFSHKGDFMIPVSIKGIEDNNGWIKIECQKDLPKDNGISYFAIDRSFPYDLHICLRGELDTTFSHYMPIIKPELPLY